MNLLGGLAGQEQREGSHSTDDAVVEVAPNLTRPGRPFLPVAELELGPALREAAARLPAPGRSQVLMLPECPLPVGVPDLLAVVADMTLLRARAAAQIPPLLAEQETRIAAACGLARPSSLERLARLAGISAQQTRRIIGSLERKGALARQGSGWVRHPALAPIGRTYAIEAKVDNWRAGISQCLRYTTYADGGGLVVAYLSERGFEAAIARAREHGIGLFHGGSWRARPRIGALPAARRLWVTEHVIAALSSE